MHKYVKVILAVVTMGLVATCVPSESDHDDRKTDAEKQQALQSSTFGPMVGTMDRAKDVEQLQQDRKQKLDQAMEASEGQ